MSGDSPPETDHPPTYTSTPLQQPQPQSFTQMGGFTPHSSQPIASSSTSPPQTHHRRMTSASEYYTPSSTSSQFPGEDYESNREFDISPSTAPTTPDLPQANQPNPHQHLRRTWRPTPGVPLHIAQRHRRDRHRDRDRGTSVSATGRRINLDEDRNRWLSEDEGVGGGSTSVGTRRRRSGDDGNEPGTGMGYGSDSENNGQSQSHAGPSGSGSGHPSGIPKFSKSRSPRPIIRRAISHEPNLRTLARTPPPSTTLSAEVGTEPPRIQDIVAKPSNAALRVDTELNQEQTSRSGWDRDHPRGGEELDYGYVAGMEDDGDGEIKKTRAKQRELLGKLRRILGCVLCPPSGNTSPPLPLHQPITLPCGHTLSAPHITLPPPIPLGVPPNAPPHEIAAAQQRQHALRLLAWAGVMCPIPTCKRYSPDVSKSPHLDEIVADIEVPSPSRSRSPIVSMYPPPGLANINLNLNTDPPAYNDVMGDSDTNISNTPTPAGSPLLDVCVDKVMNVVLREIERFDHPPHNINPPTSVFAYRHQPNLELELTDDESDPIPFHTHKSNLSQDLSQLGQPELTSPPSPLVRRSSKRRRNHLTTPPRHSGSGSGLMMNRSPSADGWGFLKDLARVVECDVCALLLFEPVTTPCQHSFCFQCLSRSLDHSTRCPVCRQDLPSFTFFQDHAVNKVLLTIIKTAFPEEYLDRGLAIERESRDSLLDTPIFVCTLAFPGMPTILHVFEPRYRLMIRRCIESSNPRFGMVLPARPGDPGQGGISEYGTMLEIQSVQMLPDGRSMVETVGTSRFKLLEKGSLDGYTIGRIERIDDISPEEELAMEREAVQRAAAARSMVDMSTSTSQGSSSGTTTTSQGVTSNRPAVGLGNLPTGIPSGLGIAPGPQPQMPNPMNMTMNPNSTFPHTLTAPPSAPGEDPSTQAQTTEELMAICRAFIEQLRSGSAPWLTQRLNNTYGTMPEGPDEFSYWMALVMPIDDYEKARLLPIRSPRLRLKLIVHWVESLRSSWWFSSGCVVG